MTTTSSPAPSAIPPLPPPRVIFLGLTGTGKSSLINALLDEDRCDIAELGGVHTTQEPGTYERKRPWSEDQPSIKIIDLPGLQGAHSAPDENGQIEEYLLEQFAEAHMAVLVVAYPTEEFAAEKEVLRDLRALLQSKKSSSSPYSFPIVVAANQIDKAPPLEEWEPKHLSLDPPSTPKEQNISTWLEGVRRHLLREELGVTEVLPCCAGETVEGEVASDDRFGIEALNDAIYRHLPPESAPYWIAVEKTRRDVETRAQYIIWGASSAAAAAALNPLPLSDALLITPIQIGMVVGLASLYGKKLTWRKAVGLLTPALGVLGGRMLAGYLAKIVPVVGSAVGATVAGVLTLTMGQAYNAFFLRGDFEPDPGELKKKLKTLYRRNKKEKHPFSSKS